MTHTETWLSSLFASINLESPDQFDADFISRGGDSLAAMLCISRIRAHFYVELSIEEFFLPDSTVKGLSRIIDNVLANSNEPISPA